MGINFQLNIEYLPVDQLTPYEHNARKHQSEGIFRQRGIRWASISS